VRESSPEGRSTAVPRSRGTGAGADGADEKPDEGRPLADPELADEQCAAESEPEHRRPGKYGQPTEVRIGDD